MAPPIRTNLDARMGFIRDALEEFIRPVKQAYMMAVDGLSIETEAVSYTHLTLPTNREV